MNVSKLLSTVTVAALAALPFGRVTAAPDEVVIGVIYPLSGPVAQAGIDAVAAINTAHNEVSSDISLAQASADQKIVQSNRAVEIETLNAQAEVEPLARLAEQLRQLSDHGSGALEAYIRNLKVDLYAKAERTFLEVQR